MSALLFILGLGLSFSDAGILPPQLFHCTAQGNDHLNLYRFEGTGINVDEAKQNALWACRRKMQPDQCTIETCRSEKTAR